MRIQISKKIVSEGKPSFIIAEAGINHNGSVKLAKKLITKAKEAGADAVKFQTYTANDLTSVNSKYYKSFKKLELKPDDFGELADFAKSKNIIFLSTPFSNDAVDLLVKLKVPAIKIAAGDLTNIPLIRYASTKQKPMILSTGMANLNEIKEAIRCVKSVKNKKIILLHSLSAYPAPLKEVNLKAIQTMKNSFPYPIGFSDNGEDMIVPIIAVALGAKLIEKHFTLNKKLKVPDQKLSADPFQFKKMVSTIRNVEQMLGDGIKNFQPSEIQNRIDIRRSLTAKFSLEKNSKITKENITSKRPATGIEPKYFNQVIGKTTRKKIIADQAIQWDFLR